MGLAMGCLLLRVRNGLKTESVRVAGDRSEPIRASESHGLFNLQRSTFIKALPQAGALIQRGCGITKLKVLPEPGRDCTSMAPPWRSTMRLQVARPRPAPGGDGDCASPSAPRWNGSNTRAQL